jgi:hypothetical protein
LLSSHTIEAISNKIVKIDILPMNFSILRSVGNIQMLFKILKFNVYFLKIFQLTN